LKISARNRLKEKVAAVEKGEITAKIKIEMAAPTTITAIISREAVEELNIKTGDEVEAVIKATEVMVAISLFNDVSVREVFACCGTLPNYPQYVSWFCTYGFHRWVGSLDLRQLIRLNLVLGE